MCPCSQNDGNFMIALLGTAAIVLAMNVLRGHWVTMRTGSKVLSVVAIGSIACVGLAFGLRGSRNEAYSLPSRPDDAASIALAADPPATSRPEAVPVSRPAATTPADQQSDKVIAYYFHRTLRCHTCLTIEELARQAIETGYAPEMTDGLMEWHSVNIEEKGNEHFEKDFDLTAQSLVLVRLENGKQTNWKNLSDVWEYVGDPVAFDKYVRTELELFLYGDAAGPR